jgi:CubicO group peptidase (beta-lactamase class C family)
MLPYTPKINEHLRNFKMNLNIKNWISISMLIFTVTGCYSLKAIKYGNPSINNYKKFPTVEIKNGETFFTFSKRIDNKLETYLDSSLLGSNTNSFIVIKNDTLIYEKYFNNYDSSTLHTSFSVAKSFVSVLLGIAIDQGKVKNTSEPITNYIPELLKNDKRFADITIQNVLDMRSGVDLQEYSHNPFGKMSKLYFGKNNASLIFTLGIKEEPNKKLDYTSINTQILTMIIERSTGMKINNFMQQQIWTPLEMQSNASWSIDSYKNKNIKSFCCINAIPLDFAKFGRLVLNKGNWNGKQIVSKEWINTSTNKEEFYKRMNGFMSYHNQWWGAGDTHVMFKDSLEGEIYKTEHPYTGKVKKSVRGVYYVIPELSGAYYAEGNHGQMIYINPNNKVIIVRLGNDSKKQYTVNNYKTWYYSEFIQILGQNL